MEALLKTMTAIERIAELCDRLPDYVARLDQPNSDLARLIDALPEPQVDPRLTITHGLGLARSSLGLVREILLDNRVIGPAVLPVLLRSALLGAGRVLYMLGPQDAHKRLSNSTVVLQQEAESLYRAYTQFEGFEQFGALVPPPETISIYEGRRVSLLQGGRPRGEAEMLEGMAQVIGEMLAAADTAVPQQEPDDDSATIAEHVRWIFQTYSGVAHGFAWPSLVPGTASLPGHFIADFTTVVNIAHAAAEMTLRRAGII